jgi:hypothetical protein
MALPTGVLELAKSPETFYAKKATQEISIITMKATANMPFFLDVATIKLPNSC